MHLRRVVCGLLLPRVLVIPGMGGSCLFNHHRQKVWPSLKTLVSSPQDLKITCTGEACTSPSAPTHLGDDDAILTRHWMLGSFYAPLLKTLRKETPRVRTAPYDFRMVMDASYLEGFYDGLDRYFSSEEGTNIVFCHSLGGLLFHDYLASSAERAGRVDRVIYINVPFDGSVIPVSFILGRVEGGITGRLLRRIENIHQFGGFYWCLPSSEKNIFRLNGIDYNSGTMRSLLDPVVRPLYDRLVERKKSLSRPPESRRVWLFSSRSPAPTPSFYDFDTMNHTSTAAGDGAVIESSLDPVWGRTCDREVFRGEHTMILSDPGFLNRCREILW